jgi:uncharacterized protein (TIGR00369 family)
MISQQKLIELYNKNNHFGTLLGMEFELIKPGEIKYFLQVKKELLATPTAMHGGAIAAFMDAIIGVAALSAVAEEQKVVSTVEFKINYLKPAIINDRLIGTGKVIQKGNRIIITEGKIYNSQNEIIAIATGTLNAYPFEKSDFNN